MAKNDQLASRPCSRGNSIPLQAGTSATNAQSTLSNFTLLQWNCNGIRTKLKELKQVIANSPIKPAIVAIQETKLKATHQLKLHGYTVTRNDCETAQNAKGGVATLIRADLSYKTLASNTPLIEALITQIQTEKGPLNILNVYLRPHERRDSQEFNNQLKRLFEVACENQAIIMGDFNAHNYLWTVDASNCGRTNHYLRGEFIESLMDRHNLTLLNRKNQCTRVGYMSSSVLDLTLSTPAYATIIDWFIVNNAMGSDHNPIKLLVNLRLTTQGHYKPKWLYEKANWKNFQETLSREEINLDDSIDEIEGNVTKAILAAACDSIPKHMPKPYQHKGSLPFWDGELSQLVKARNVARNKFTRNRTHVNRQNYCRLRGITQAQIKRKSKQHWTDYCNQLDRNSKLNTVWNKLKAMSGNKSPWNMGSLEGPQGLIHTNKGKADILAAQFQQSSSNANYSNSFLAVKQQKETEIETQLKEQIKITTKKYNMSTAISMSELTYSIKTRSDGKAPGHEGITHEMLKKLPHSFKEVVLKFFNKIWETGIVPVNWKHAIILPLLKNGKQAELPASYRPISLTPVLCKLLERIVTDRLTSYLEVKKLINSNQTGYRKGLSTIDQIAKIHDYIHKVLFNPKKSRSLMGRKTALAVFIDFEKAYDMVWKHGLMAKLMSLGVKGHMLNYIFNFIAPRTFQVEVSGTRSDPVPLDNGTPQGSVISPVLFMVMINDLVVKNDGMQQSIFADDLAYYKAGQSLQQLTIAMQEEMDHVHAWCQKWGFTPSPTKTALLPFVPLSQSAPYIAISLGGKYIENVTTFKFLGVILDQHLRYDVHLDNLITKCKRRINLMRALAGTTYGSAKKPLLTVYKALIRSLIDYGSIVYDKSDPAYLESLQRIQNQALRLACGVNMSTPIVAMQNECGEMPLHLRRQLLIRHYRIKVQQTIDHPSASIFEKSDQTNTPAQLRRYSAKYQTLFLKSGTFKVKPNDLRTPRIIFNRNITPDLTLKRHLDKTDNNDKLKNLALAKISEYQHLTHYYTDASKDEAGKVGIAIVSSRGIPPMSTRITDHTSVYRAELEAVMQVVAHIVDEETEEAVIFTDSLSVVQAVANVRNAVSNEEIKFLCEYANDAKNPIHLCWIPGHVGIQGNEQADRHAKEATKLPNVQTPITPSTSYYRQKALDEILPLWQLEYDQAEAGKRYKRIEPIVSQAIKGPIHKDRWKDRICTLIKLGSLYTNERKVKCLISTDPRCSACNQEETLEHLIFQCQANQVAPAICNHLGKSSDQVSIKQVVQSSEAMEVLFKYLTTQRPETLQPFPRKTHNNQSPTVTSPNPTLPNTPQPQPAVPVSTSPPPLIRHNTPSHTSH